MKVKMKMKGKTKVKMKNLVDIRRLPAGPGLCDKCHTPATIVKIYGLIPAHTFLCPDCFARILGDFAETQIHRQCGECRALLIGEEFYLQPHDEILFCGVCVTSDTMTIEPLGLYGAN